MAGPYLSVGNANTYRLMVIAASITRVLKYVASTPMITANTTRLQKMVLNYILKITKTYWLTAKNAIKNGTINLKIKPESIWHDIGKSMYCMKMQRFNFSGLTIWL